MAILPRKEGETRQLLTKDSVTAMEAQFADIRKSYNDAKSIRNEVRSELADTASGTRLFEQHEQQPPYETLPVLKQWANYQGQDPTEWIAADKNPDVVMSNDEDFDL